MKYALVDGQRLEAQPGLTGTCPTCHDPMIAKCGEVKVRHWAHKGTRICDLWWENETAWHRTWKDRFPSDWQECAHVADDGERHIADVKTVQGWTIEFQHSYLNPQERRSRDAFYPKLIWVVDGTRRKRDKTQLLSAWNDSRPAIAYPAMRWVRAQECALLVDWKESHAHVLFDLGEELPLFYRLAKDRSNGSAYMIQLPRNEFVDIHRGREGPMNRDTFEEVMQYLYSQIHRNEQVIRRHNHAQLVSACQQRVNRSMARSRRRL